MWESLQDIRASISHADQIRFMGWGLLLLWTLSITYMTRDFWFPSAFGLPPLSERMMEPVASPRMTSKKLSISGRELKLLTMDRRRHCESFVAKTRRPSRKRGDSLPSTLM